MPAMRRRFHWLKRPKVRQTMNKYNLFNLSRLGRIGRGPSATFFQQKWAAKSHARAYHGEHVREHWWERAFDRHMPAVVPMDAHALAASDGSREAAGRGAGRDMHERVEAGVDWDRGAKGIGTPFMNMVFHPMERRLDQAIFRALFASSARQARQFVVHGFVTVNGKKMRQPGYLLNPGDMFQVEPDRVLYALGARKDQANDPIHDSDRIDNTLKPSNNQTEIVSDEGYDSSFSSMSETELAAFDAEELEPEESAAEDVKKTLKDLQKRVKNTLASETKGLTAKDKQRYRALKKQLQQTMSKASSASPESVAELEQTLESLDAHVAALKAGDDPKKVAAAASEGAPDRAELERLERESRILEELKKKEAENPYDPSKPYLTPWRPRDWMAPFVFIPRYLEVNQRICAAVYLRHPVARPGMAEVPSPFPHETHQLAFNWYLRRR
ncbi:hypothetical protein BDY21DRAFT_347828 [Lineolata rhizophorae]|uniref:Small ribosomal subunit protein uS4m n=1 Tax=Lineolata rhizophorae TaxID=578093 RepID=A0A6A6NWA6_9PEZI|nr:hypothetical protein BDY21DRAFT_347828 [Lineolata rhizophorae]